MRVGRTTSKFPNKSLRTSNWTSSGHHNGDRLGRRYSILPLILAVVAIALLLSIASQFFLSSSTTTSRYSHKDAPVVSSTEQGGAISCRTVQERVQSGEWHDPNNGRVYTREIVTEPHFIMSVHTKDYDEVRWKTIYEQGDYYETLVRSRFLSILKNTAPGLVLDVGANIGYYTLLSAALGHRVLSFEINPANLVRLCESLVLNNKLEQRVTLFQNGVSNTHGSPLQVLVPKNPGQAFMKELEKEAGAKKETGKNDTSTHHAYTTTVTLDDFARQHGWLDDKSMRISVLKLDVEGKEPQIIEGAQQLLQSGKVDNILTEFRRLGRPTIQTAIRTLLDCGYTLVQEHGEEEAKHQQTPPRRLSQAESERVLNDLRNELKGSGRNVDLWFQRAR